MNPDDYIPHRPPFRLLDDITEIREDGVCATMTLREDDALWSQVYAGHYPGQPITPGVLLCEMVFQAAAVWMGHRLQQAGDNATGVPVLTKIGGARFKQMVRPGDTVTINAMLDEQISNACYMTGTVKVGGKLAVRVEFAVALVTEA